MLPQPCGGIGGSGPGGYPSLTRSASDRALEKGDIVGFEALLRWNEDEGDTGRASAIQPAWPVCATSHSLRGGST